MAKVKFYVIYLFRFWPPLIKMSSQTMITVD